MRYTFGTYVVDTQQYDLYRAGERLALRPKAFQVLLYLLAHRERVVSPTELLEQVWAEAFVGDAALSSCLKTLRRALDDDGQAQRVIRTVRGHGYRFVAPVTVVDGPAGCSALPPGPDVARPTAARHAACLVGRDTELADLQRGFARTLQGERQLVLITGEAGIGKTMLVETLLARVTTPGLWIGHGQCIEQYGAGEAYLPLLEALSRLGRAPEGRRLVEVLQHAAPSWLVQMPALIPADTHERLQRLAQGTTAARMLRELTDALELLTATHPFILVLEDLQWSDVSTLAWLDYMARRRDAAQLLILGTYRPQEALGPHPLSTVTPELVRQHKATVVDLAYLSVVDVSAYLAQRFGPVPWAAELAAALRQRTSGHPFCMVAIVEDLLPQGRLMEEGGMWVLQDDPRRMALEAPATVRHLIEQQFMLVCPATQALLEVASVAGVEFTAAAVAAGLGQSVEAVEAQCEGLVRQQRFVHPHGTERWPDGTATARYRFQHALYQEVLYARLVPSQGRRLHQQIGMRQEAGYGRHARQIAAALAIHFLRSQDTWRAVHYLHRAAENALQRSAYREATTLTLLADAYGRSGQVDVGLGLLTAALQDMQEHGARYLEAEIWRLQGEFLLRQAVPEPSRAEACLQRALDVARRQQAKWWELRAAVSLHRLWQRQDKGAQACQRLAEVYAWFTEGFATADLQEARILLEA